ncbi:MAG: hypothetical protein HRU75_07415 [Planctomycetia bacterium]|nr:MAG: hypothetical protein HRU75_07415 [Planctomycetia bacterium]
MRLVVRSLILVTGVWIVAGMTGCGDAKPRDPAVKLPGKAELEARARTLWEARVRKDWKTAWDFVQPRVAAASSPEQFIEWCEKSEPFIYESYALHGVDTDGEYGWAHLTYSTRIRQFPTHPAREADHWQKWYAIEGRWYPVVEPRERDACPEPPALRNLAAEPRLRERFAQASRLRAAKDWSALLKMVDPGDLEGVDESTFIREQEKLTITSERVVWVQAIGERGTVFVVYTAKLNDPSMQNLPESQTPLLERWIHRDGEWYRDLRTPAPESESAEQPTEGGAQ